MDRAPKKLAFRREFFGKRKMTQSGESLRKKSLLYAEYGRKIGWVGLDP